MLSEEARGLQGQLVEWRRALHQMPETGLLLPHTRAYLCAALDAMKVPYRLHQGTSGIEAIISGAQGGNTIALRADMDALPVAEQSGLPFAARDGQMHACGHDAHMAMLLGAIKLLDAHAGELRGQVKCIFQPGEEGYHGARHMLEEGVLENPHVDAVLGLHVTNTIPELRAGCIGLKKGPLMAGSDAFTITVTGKGGHISDTAHVHNPIPVAGKIALGIQALGEGCREAGERAVIALGAICGGEKGNVIPDTVLLKGSIRTFSKAVRARLLEGLEQCAAQACAQGGCQYRLHLADSNGIIFNDEDLTSEIMESASRLFPETGYTEIVSEIMASEDIFHFFETRKGTYIHLGCGFDDGREIFPLHSGHFVLNEDILWRGAAMLAQSAADWLNGR